MVTALQTYVMMSLHNPQPNLPTPADPRPSLPYSFFDAVLGVNYVHTNFGNPAQDRQFGFFATWKSNGHQLGQRSTLALVPMLCSVRRRWRSVCLLSQVRDYDTRMVYRVVV